MPVVSVTPTISTSAYADGDVIGGKLTIKRALGLRGLLTNITVSDKDGEGVQLDFFFFNADLTGTYTDNVAFAINSADEPNLIGVASILTTDYIAAGSDSAGTVAPIDIVIDRGISGNENLYAVCVIRSITTFTTTSDLRFNFGWVIT